MCFIPLISISTAFIEFTIAIFILYHFKKTKYRNTTALFITFLGLYQVSEYLLCTTNNPYFWGKISFIVYTFLPALGIKMIFEYFNIYNTKTLINNIKIFITPILFSGLAILKKDLVSSASCEKFFVIVTTTFSQNHNLILKIIYNLYYFGLIIMIFFIIHQYKHKKSKKEIFWIYLTFLISLVPAMVLLIIFPEIYYKFPSIYCHFSLLTSFCLIKIFYLKKNN